MRTIANRLDRGNAFHNPVGISNVVRGASLDIADAIKKTSLETLKQALEDNPLYFEFAKGTDIDDMAILDYVDLSVTPLDITDQERLKEVFVDQARNFKLKFDRYEAEKQAKIKNFNSSRQASPSPARIAQKDPSKDEIE